MATVHQVMTSIVISCWFYCLLGVVGQYEWQTRDSFDEIRMRMDKVNDDNCPIQHLGDLYLSEDAVSHLPDIKDININPVCKIFRAIRPIKY